MTKQLKLPLQLLFLVIILVLVSLPVLAIDPTNDPTPTIRVEFDPEDAPLTNVYGMVTSVTTGFNVVVDGVEQNPTTYDFPVTDYLFPGFYNFLVSAIDSDLNELIVEDTFEVNGSDIQMWVTDPEIPYFPEKTQKIGMGYELPFTLNISTKYPSICKLKKYTGDMQGDDLENEFLTAAILLNNGDQTYKLDHTIDVVASGTGGQNTIPIIEPFDYSDMEDESYAILCKRVSSEGGVAYSVEKFYIGYDPISPDFEVNYNPEIIVDENELWTSMNVTTQGDRVACVYNYLTNPSPGQDDSVGEMPQPLSSIIDIYQYEDQKEKNFTFPGKNFAINTPYVFNVEVSCHNPAMLMTVVEKAYTVNVTRNLDVTLQETHYGTTKPDLVFETNLLAWCDYEFEGETGYIDGQNEKLIHELRLNTEDGEHEIDIHCQTSLLAHVNKKFTFTVDTTEPQDPILEANEYSCGEDPLSLGIAEALEPVRRHISFSNATDVLWSTITSLTSAQTELELPGNLDLEEGMMYVWSAYANDSGGLTSGTSNFAVTITPFDGILCDFLPPSGSISTAISGQGYEVTVHCQDDLSGCTDTYQYSIIDTLGNCTNSYPGNTQGNYDTPILFPQNGKLCYTVYDQAGLSDSNEATIAAELNIELESPLFGIASEKEFRFAVNTNRAATCRHGYFGSAHPDDLDDWYLTLEPFNQTGGMTHSSLIDVADYDPPFDPTQNEEEVSWVVICKEGELYHDKPIAPFGYDITPPNIEVTATPNPVVDPGNLVTTLSVTVDDKAACTYLDSDGVPVGFEGYDPDDETAYKTSHEVEIEYWGINSLYEDEQLVSCRNLAQENSEEELTITVEPEDNVQITINTPKYVNYKSVTFDVSTLQKANCEWRLDIEDDYTSFQNTGDYEHTTTKQLNEEEYTLEVLCEARGNGDLGLASKDITVDITPPTIEILPSDTTCSLEELNLKIIADGTGSPLDKFEYNISNGTEVIAEGSIQKLEIEESLDLVAGTPYQVIVTAYDLAGNTKTTQTTITATEYDPIACDTTPPTGDIDGSLIWGGMEIEVSCYDDQGCSDLFNYILAEDDNCAGSPLVKKYVDLPITITESASVCYEIFDLSGNSFADSERFVVIEQCFNGIEDPDEEGVDCGGPCVANCNTCSNGRIDPFEQGIDCGGICPTNCVQDPNDLDNDTLPDDWEIEYFGNLSQGPYDDWEPDGILNIDEYEGGTDPTVDDGTSSGGFNPEDECQIDSDCAPGEFCNYKKECEKDTPISTTPTTQDEGSNIWGWILIILGIVLMGGGAYYIYYSKDQKEKAIHQKEQEVIASRAAMTAAQREADEKRLARLKEEHLKQRETRDKKLEERKKKRKSLLGVFDVGDEEKENKDITSENKNDEDIEDNDESDENKDETKEDKKLDEGFKEDYIEVDKLGKKPELKDETHFKKPLKPKKKTKKQDSFLALKELIKKKQPVSPVTEKPKPLTSHDVVEAFAKDLGSIKRLDEHTLVSLLKVMFETKKINAVTVRNILHELADKEYIPKEDIDVLFKKIE